MAMTGGTSYLLKSEKTNYGSGNDTVYLYLYVKESVSVISNKSTISVGLYVKSTYNIGEWSDFKGSYVGLSTSGSNCHSFNGTLPYGKGTRWLVENVQYNVQHNSDGKKTARIYWHWGVNSPWGGYKNPSGYKDVVLTNIDRTAPSVSLGISSITVSGFKISATSSVACDSFDYSLDGGSTWKNFSTTAGTSASATISSLSPNTSYSVKVRARKKTNHVYGSSSTSSVKTLGQAVLNSCTNFYADEESPILTINTTVYDASYEQEIDVQKIEFNRYKPVFTTIFTIPKATWTAGTNNRSYTLTAAQRAAILDTMATATRLGFVVLVRTYNGDKVVGTSSQSITVYTSAEKSAPVFTDFSFADISSCVDVTGDNQKLVQGYSKLKITCQAATARNGASIVGYAATIADVSVQSSGTTIDCGVINKSGTLKLIVSAIDSRGYSTTLSANIVVLPYSKVAFKKVAVRRANGIDATIQLSFEGHISSIKPVSSNVNYIDTCWYRYKTTDGDEKSWSSQFSLKSSVSVSGETFSFSTLELASLDVDKSYDIQLFMHDRISDANASLVIPRGISAVRVLRDKVGINNPNPQYALDVVGDIKATGKVMAGSAEISGAASVGSLNSRGLASVAGLNINGSVGFDDGEQTSERVIRFHNDNGKYPHDCILFGGNPASTTGIGLWDNEKNKAVYVYNDVDGTVRTDFPASAPSIDSSGNINADGNITFEHGEQTNGRSVVFKNTKGTRKHHCSLYGGNPSSATAIGLWDDKNDRAILVYNDVDNKIQLGSSGVSLNIGGKELFLPVSLRVLNDMSALHNKPSAFTGYGRCLMIGATGDSDRYYILIDSGCNLFVGKATNKATTITWVSK